MKYCNNCGKQLNEGEGFCSGCGTKVGGAPVNQPVKKKGGLPAWVIVLIVLGVIFFMLVGCVAGCTNTVNKAVEETKNSYKDVNGKTSFKVKETFENSYEKITLLEVNTDFKDYSQYNKPASGKKYVMAKFEVENIKQDNDELYVSSLSFNAFADGEAVNQNIFMGDKYKGLSATLTYGKKAVGYVFYEVPTNAQSITIDYNADFWTDGTKIEFVVK